MKRGAFIVLEGLDRAGKSTQVSMLIQSLTERSIPVEKRVFPDRSIASGKLIDEHLTRKVELSPEGAHLLFSANRWDRKDAILEALKKGTTVIVDRYAASGAAYSGATTGNDLEWCKSPDRGLPAPDLVLFLEVSSEAQERRSNWGEERFERADLQRKAADNFRRLAEPSWVFVDASRPIGELHQSLLQQVLDVIEQCKDKPIRALYE